MVPYLVALVAKILVNCLIDTQIGRRILSSSLPLCFIQFVLMTRALGTMGKHGVTDIGGSVTAPPGQATATFTIMIKTVGSQILEFSLDADPSLARQKIILDNRRFMRRKVPFPAS